MATATEKHLKKPVFMMVLAILLAGLIVAVLPARTMIVLVRMKQIAQNHLKKNAMGVV
jgi:hypothetical protein